MDRVVSGCGFDNCEKHLELRDILESPYRNRATVFRRQCRFDQRLCHAFSFLHLNWNKSALLQTGDVVINRLVLFCMKVSEEVLVRIHPAGGEDIQHRTFTITPVPQEKHYVRKYRRRCIAKALYIALNSFSHLALSRTVSRVELASGIIISADP